MKVDTLVEQLTYAVKNHANNVASNDRHLALVFFNPKTENLSNLMNYDCTRGLVK